jgi:tetratricopeptide (TPR) repeat protein
MIHRSFHWKRLLLVLGVFLILGGTLFAINRMQVRSQASIIKTAAEKAAAVIDGDDAKRAEAIVRYGRYLKFAPNDEQAATHYAQLLLDQYKAADSPAAAEVAMTGLENFLRSFPDHPDLRRQLAELYRKSGKFANAREHLEMMYNSPKGDAKKNAELLELLALCEFDRGDLTRAIERFEEAISVSRENTPLAVQIRLYQQTLDLLSQNKSDGQRETKIANHVRTLLNDPTFQDNIDARIVVARFELGRNELTNARRDVAVALKLSGDKPNADALMAAAELEKAEARLNPVEKDRRAKLTAARDYLLKAHTADKKNVAVGVFLADILEMLGERPRAVEVLRTTADALGEVNDLYIAALDHLIDLGNQEVAKSLVDRVKARAATQPIMQSWVAYFNGRLAVLKGDWMEAKPLLEEASRNLVRAPESHKRALYDLSRVYEVLQNPDQQLECCRSALRDAGPLFPAALIGEAEALAKLGKLEEAVAKYQALVTTFQATQLRPTLVRLRLLDTLRRPPENRNWEVFDSTDNLGALQDRTDEINILHAQSLAARGEKAKAIALLEAILKKEPPSPLTTTAYVNLARIKESGKPEAAMAILEDAEKQVGQTVDLRLARADVLVARAKPPSAADFDRLGVDADKFLKPDQYRLWLGLGQASLFASPRVTDPEARKALLDAALRFFQKAAQTEPRDLLSRSALIDLAVLTNNKEVIDSTLKELKTLEGEDGPIRSLCQVVIAFPDVPKITNQAERAARIKELRDLATSVQKQRPFWGRVYVALGRLDELEGFTERAVENYRKALDAGDRDEFVIRRTVQLYRERKQDALAASVLDGLATKMVLPDDLERFRAIFEMLNRPVPRSELPTINRIAPADSKDYKILLLRGSLLAAIREEDMALKAFRDAVLLKGIAETYETLVGQLVRTAHVSEAKDALAEAERTLSPDALKTAAERAELYIALGRMHEMVGDPKAAVVRYQKAVEIAPSELNPHRRLVEFLMRTGHSADAEKMLLTLTAHPGQDIARWARRYLASVVYLARPNPYEQRIEALKLIRINLAAAPNDPEDIKAEAIIKTVDPVTRDEGVEVLKEFWKRGDLNPDEAYRLARLTFDLGPSKIKIAESVNYFESAARPRPGVSLEHLAWLVRVHSALGDLGTAEVKLERLKTAAPNSWEATREEAWFLMRKSHTALLAADPTAATKYSERARELILKFPGHDTPEAIRFRTGPLLEELGFPNDAETLYKKLLTTDSPTAHMPLALLYIRQKKTADAIELAWSSKYEAKAPVLVTAALVTGAVRVSRPSAEIEKKIADWLDQKIAAASKADLPGLLCSRGELFDAQGKYKEAIAEYRRALAVGPSETATNNLAMLLALYEAPSEPGKADEAINMMSDLIAKRGPAPTFLDTRAVAYIIKGGDDTSKAIQDLEMALLQRTRAVYLFHLAWAYDLQGKRLERDRRLDEAKKVGLSRDDVHQLEWDKFRQFVEGVPK